MDDLALDFTLPGYDIELRVSRLSTVFIKILTSLNQPGGRDTPVTSENVEQYVQEVLDVILGSGVQPQAKAFREGFSKVFPVTDLQAFTADELIMLFGNSNEDWTAESAPIRVPSHFTY